MKTPFIKVIWQWNIVIKISDNCQANCKFCQLGVQEVISKEAEINKIEELFLQIKNIFLPWAKISILSSTIWIDHNFLKNIISVISKHYIHWWIILSIDWFSNLEFLKSSEIIYYRWFKNIFLKSDFKDLINAIKIFNKSHEKIIYCINIDITKYEHLLKNIFPWIKILYNCNYKLWENKYLFFEELLDYEIENGIFKKLPYKQCKSLSSYVKKESLIETNAPIDIDFDGNISIHKVPCIFWKHKITNIYKTQKNIELDLETYHLYLQNQINQGSFDNLWEVCWKCIKTPYWFK